MASTSTARRNRPRKSDDSRVRNLIANFGKKTGSRFKRRT